MTDYHTIPKSSPPRPMDADLKPEKDRSRWTVKKFTNHEDLRVYGIKQWQKQSGAARRQAA